MKLKLGWVNFYHVALVALATWCSLLIFERIVHAQTATLWFTVTSGNTNCQASIIAQTLSRISYKCSNLYGISAGSYSTDPVNGINGVNVLELGMVNNVPVNLSFPAGQKQTSEVTCQIAFNETTQSVGTIVNFGTIPPNTAVYQCHTFSTTNAGSTPWP
jgi:hypothetical protein